VHQPCKGVSLFKSTRCIVQRCVIWCCCACAGEYQECLRAGISTALARLRDYDLDTREGLSQELAQAAEFLDQAARLAMAAMLQVRPADGAASLSWLLSKWGLPVRMAVTTTATDRWFF
jgi:hypothetical protein